MNQRPSTVRRPQWPFPGSRPCGTPRPHVIRRPPFAVGGALVASLCLAFLSLAHSACGAEPGLLHDWSFSPQHAGEGTVRDLVGGAHASIIGPAVFLQHPDRLKLDGEQNRVPVTDDHTTVALPKREMTLEAWACIDVPGEWGGLVSAIQDNGTYEKGWVLGNRRGHFAFALSTVGADDGDGLVTYLEACSEVPTGALCHVVGVYDGAVMRIYVNGEIEGTSTVQSGDINYPPRTWLELGAYHDDDELLLLRGSLARVRIYDRALSQEDVRDRFREYEALLPAPYRFSEGPRVRHIAVGEVEVSWRSAEPEVTVFSHGPSEQLGQTLREPRAIREHRVRLSGLPPERDWYYTVGVEGPDRPRVSELLSLDTSTDLLPRVEAGRLPSADDKLSAWYRRAAEIIVARSGATQGYCLDLGCGDGRLAAEIARLTDLQIVGIERDAKKVAAAREALSAAGLYGVRVTVRQGDPAAPQVTPRSMNLVVSQQALLDGRLPAAPAQVLELLCPYRGFACIGQPDGESPGGRLTVGRAARWLGESAGPTWETVREQGLWLTARGGAPPGAGDWPHPYADSGNTACSGDELTAPLRVQWFGRPGPRNMIDRHHRAQGAVVCKGRLIVPGNNRVLAVDAANGTVLWDVEIAGSRRVGALRDCGHLVATEQYVYVAAEDKCYSLAAETGEPGRVYRVPEGAVEGPAEWGYVACEGELLIGSGQRRGSARTGMSRGTIADGTYYDARPVVCSRALHATHRKTGQLRWLYRRPGGSLIINTAIALGDGAVYFVESRSPEALARPEGRLPLETLLGSGDTFLVKLRLQDGEEVFSRPVDLACVRHVLHLCHAKGTLVAVGSCNEDDHPRYDLWAHSAADGEPLWHNDVVLTDMPPDGGHGEQDQHPTIVGDKVFSRPYAFDLGSGEQLDFRLDRGGHGCGTLSASAHYLYGRGGNPRLYPIADGGKTNAPLTRVTRPGCWVNIIPAGGMVLIPESSSGCTCGYSLQTSLGLIPVEG